MCVYIYIYIYTYIHISFESPLIEECAIRQVLCREFDLEKCAQPLGDFELPKDILRSRQATVLGFETFNLKFCESKLGELTVSGMLVLQPAARRLDVVRSYQNPDVWNHGFVKQHL